MKAMKTKHMLLGFVLGLALVSATASAADLTITIKGLRGVVGNVALCVFAEEGSDTALFPDCEKGKPLRSATLKIADGTASVTYTGLKDGAYAVALIHDENANGRLDTNFLGIPTEGIGVSNNPRLFGKPAYGEARFTLSGKAAVTIQVKYFL